MRRSRILCLAPVSRLLVKKVKPRAAQVYFAAKDVNNLVTNQLIMTVFDNKMFHKTSSDRAYLPLFDEHEKVHLIALSVGYSLFFVENCPKSAVDFEGEKRDRLFSNEIVFPQRLPSTHLARLNEINLDIPPHQADVQLANPLETSSEY